jgi:sirohydrochlorin ferrochelatase
VTSFSAGRRAPALVVLAHGSRDPRSAATVAALAELVAQGKPGLNVAVSFLDLSVPRLADVLASAHAAGHRDVVVVPLLLGHAYHARADVPAAVAAGRERYSRLRVQVSEVLGGVTGGTPALATAALHRLAEVAGDLDDPELGVVLAGAGSSHPPANAALALMVRRWAAVHGWAGARVAFAAGEPTVTAAITELRAAGARRIAVASWFLAAGRLTDRIAAAVDIAAPGCPAAAPMGAHPLLARLIHHRYEHALAWRSVAQRPAVPAGS